MKDEEKKVTWTLTLLEELDVLPSKYFKKLSTAMEYGKCGCRRGRISTGYSVFLPETLWWF